MFNDSNRLTIDIKTLDKLREWFSQRTSSSNVSLSCLILGDTDVDYELSHKSNDIKILNAPYSVDRVKHKLIYEGVSTNLTGKITAFLRHINSNGQVESLYNYPPSLNFSLGINPPTLINGFDFDTLNFNSITTNPEGYICYLQTLPDNYLDSNAVQQRLVEEYGFQITGMPNTWEMIIDELNGSFLLAKPVGYVLAGGTFTIKVLGKLSGITKTLTVNK